MPMNPAPPQNAGMAGPTGPATISPQSQGLRVQGLAMGNLAMHLLAKALPMLGPSTEEGIACSEAIAKLGKRFSAATGDLEQQQVKMLASQVKQPQQPSPQQGSAWEQMIAGQNKQMLPQGAPPAAA